MNINKASWHYKLAELGDDYIHHGWYPRHGRLDFCTYARAICIGGLKYALAGWLLFGLAYCVMDFGLWVAVSLLNTWFFPPIGALVVALLLVIGVAASIFGAMVYGSRKVIATGPIRAAYKGWKEKYCPLVEWAD